MTRNWPRGSEWRKWDLHVHSPGTKLNDQFKHGANGPWDEYCRLLKESDVQVFGITDYFSADGYLRTLDEFAKRYPDSEKILFPNIELRTSYTVNKAREEVNVHLIFNPSQPNCGNKIQKFLRQLKTNKTESNSDLHITAADLRNTRDFEGATTTREFILEALHNTYGRKANLVDHLLIITAANNDGIRAESGRKRKGVIADEFDKFSNAFFGNSGNVEYFLRNNRAEDPKESTQPKPVLSGSDAHSFDDIKQSLGKISSTNKGITYEPTWIKSDLTFEGLKQVIFEPENRVYIGEEPDIERRVRENSTKYIAQLNVTCIDDYKEQHGIWFKDEQIPLGKELVAIIGNKGSGKSAITDIIGLLGNSHNQTSNRLDQKSEVLFSFLNKEKFLKKGCADNFQGELVWHDKVSSRKFLSAEVSANMPERVEYLPQKYLERICGNIADDEFRATLNEVVFRYVKPQERHKQSTLNDLIEYLTQQANEDIQDHQHELRQATDKLVALEEKLTDGHYEKIKGRLHLKEEELNAHTKEAPDKKLKPPSTSTDFAIKKREKIAKLENRIAELERQTEHLRKEQINLTEIIDKLSRAEQAIQRKADALLNLKSNYQEAFRTVDLAFEDIVSLTLDFGILNALVVEKHKKLKDIENVLLTEEEITQRYKDGAEIKIAISKSIICQKAKMEKKKSRLTERLSKPEHEYQAYLNKRNRWEARKKEIQGDPENLAADSLTGLQQELERIRETYPEDRCAARKEQIRIGKEVFRKKKSLISVYSEIKKSIDVEIEKCRDELGNYTISVEAGLQLDTSFTETFLDYINHNIRGSFYGVEEGRAMLQKLCDTVDDWGTEEQVFDTLTTIINALHEDKRNGSPNHRDKMQDVFKQMKQGVSVSDLYNYLYSFDYLKPKYDLKVDQKSLSELSPGERGGLLLIFYLMLDKQDIPLVIDQPEDNLDNQSVYEILAKFIKEAKKRRQIILVTHNPNLAVAADAEQIIHVSINKEEGKHEFDFLSGSIENPKINQIVVNILEGTMPAFDNRRLKYRRQ